MGRSRIRADKGKKERQIMPKNRSMECLSEMKTLGEEGRLNMKTYTLAAALLLAVPVVAQQAAPQSAQPVAQPAAQLTGHILSAETHRSHHSTSVYNPSTGQTSSGGGTSIERDTEIQVGNLIYESSQIHKEVQVGKDYPVTIETDKHGVPKKLDLIVGEKTYTYRITGTREAKSN